MGLSWCAVGTPCETQNAALEVAKRYMDGIRSRRPGNHGYLLDYMLSR